MELVRENKEDSVYSVIDEVLDFAVMLGANVLSNGHIKIKHTDKDIGEKILQREREIISERLAEINSKEPKTIDLEQGTDKWKEERYKFVTSTQSIKTYETISDHALRLAVIEKYDIAEELLLEDRMSSVELMKRGNDLEPVVRDYYITSTGVEVLPTVLSKGIFLSSLDGYNKEKGKILEIKIIKALDYYRYKVNPSLLLEKHRTQLEIQQYVTGARDTTLIAYSPLLDEFITLDFTINDSALVKLDDINNTITKEKEAIKEVI